MSDPKLFLRGTNPEVHCETTKEAEEEKRKRGRERERKKKSYAVPSGRLSALAKNTPKISQSHSVLLRHNAGALEVKRHGGINTKK